MQLSDRTKVTRGVMGFLALCAVVGFITGLKGALPAQVYEDSQAPLASTPTGVVVEAAPASEPLAAPPQEETAEEEEKPPEEEKAEEAPAPAPQPAPQTPPADTPAAAPSEEAPPSDPVGELLEQQPVTAPRPPIY